MTVLLILRTHYAGTFARVAQAWRQRGHRPRLAALVADHASLARFDENAFDMVWRLSDLVARAEQDPAATEQGLEHIDQEVDGRLWELLYADRTLAGWTARPIERRAAALYRVLDGLYRQLDPQLVLVSETALFYETLAVQMARRRGIAVRVPVMARLPYHRLALVEGLDDRWLDLEENYCRLLADGLGSEDRRGVDKLLEDIRGRRLEPVYKAADRVWSTLETRAREFDRLGEFLRMLYWYARGDRAGCHWDLGAVARRKAFRSFGYYRDKWAAPFEAPCPGERYVLFPLQVAAEVSVTLLGRYLGDQAGVAANIARALGPGVRLYIKETQGALGTRPPGFHRQLARLPNARLIDPGADMHRLIEGSIGVVTISSTAGLEALIFGRPVALLGRACYGAFEEVARPGSFEELGPLVRRWARGGFGYSPRRLVFLAALLGSTWPGQVYDPFYIPYTHSEENIGRLVDLMEAQIDRLGSRRTASV